MLIEQMVSKLSSQGAGLGNCRALTLGVRNASSGFSFFALLSHGFMGVEKREEKRGHSWLKVGISKGPEAWPLVEVS